MSRRVFQRLDKLEIPPRPKLVIGGKEPFRGHGPFHGFETTASKIFRLTWSHPSGTQYARIKMYEVFACVQRVRSPEISRWRKIAEIIPRRGKDSLADRIGNNNERKAVSRRMAGVIRIYNCC